jgi:hypothetical protein
MQWIDAPLLDVASIFAGLLAYVVQKFAKGLHWTDSRLLFDIANGFAVPPVILLALSALNSHLLDAIKTGSRLTLILAAAAALFALFDPRRSGESSQ